jgi:hypothetical protein
MGDGGAREHLLGNHIIFSVFAFYVVGVFFNQNYFLLLVQFMSEIRKINPSCQYLGHKSY